MGLHDRSSSLSHYRDSNTAAAVFQLFITGTKNKFRATLCFIRKKRRLSQIDTRAARPHSVMRLILVCILFDVALACVWNDKTYSDGETWVDGSFKVKCTFGSRGGWSTSIIACVTPKGTEVAVDSQLTEDDVVYTCSKGSSEGSVNFNWKLSQ
nr:putative major allergen [Haemonchus contortus]